MLLRRCERATSRQWKLVHTKMSASGCRNKSSVSVSVSHATVFANSCRLYSSRPAALFSDDEMHNLNAWPACAHQNVRHATV